MTSVYNHRGGYYARGPSVLASLQHLKRAEAELWEFLSTARAVGDQADRRLSLSEKPSGISRMHSSCSAENLATHSVAALESPDYLWLHEHSIASVQRSFGLVLGENTAAFVTPPWQAWPLSLEVQAQTILTLQERDQGDFNNDKTNKTKRLLAWLRTAFSARDSKDTYCPPRALHYALTWNMPYQNTGFGSARMGLKHKLRQYFFKEAKVIC